MKPPLLSLEGVSKTYRDKGKSVTVLSDINLQAYAGETIWIRGASGSGKSSLLRVAGLLCRPDTGRIKFHGVEASASSDGWTLRRRTIGVVFQQSNLLGELTAAENLRIAASGMTVADASSRLKALGLEYLSDRPAKQLSGGEAQRVAFCRAVVNDPEILLIDEPTSGLDKVNAELLLEVMRAARRNGRTLLVASHDPVVAPLADRIVNLEGGRIV